MELEVVVGTFGEARWRTLAIERAIPSARRLGVRVVHKHRGTLAEARNAGLAAVRAPWVVHLDADDELEPGYVEALSSGTADVRAPAVRHVWPRWSSEPEVPRVWGHDHDCRAECLREGNWVPVGAAVRTELARRVGWEEFGWSEDWAYFARLWRAGATFEAVPGAVYRAHRSARSRNRVPRAVGLRWHREIEAAVFGEAA